MTLTHVVLLFANNLCRYLNSPPNKQTKKWDMVKGRLILNRAQVTEFDNGRFFQRKCNFFLQARESFSVLYRPVNDLLRKNLLPFGLSTEVKHDIFQYYLNSEFLHFFVAYNRHIFKMQTCDTPYSVNIQSFQFFRAKKGFSFEELFIVEHLKTVTSKRLTRADFCKYLLTSTFYRKKSSEQSM